jgi:pimeloyl-ACP methyl ester carboxylesterase
LTGPALHGSLAASGWSARGYACRSTGIARAGARSRCRTSNPILVIGKRYDPRTRFANAQLAARRLGNAVLLTLNGYGHTSDNDPSACIEEAVGNYLVNLIPPAQGTICEPDRHPFEPDFGKPVL